MHKNKYFQDNHAVIHKKESDSRESTESQLCNPMYLTPAWLPRDSCEYPYTSWCAAEKDGSVLKKPEGTGHADVFDHITQILG